MAVLGHFFAKYIFCGYDEGRLFLGGHVGLAKGHEGSLVTTLWDAFPLNL